MLARELIKQSLRLINEPGEGMELPGGKMAQAVATLKGILAGKAVSKAVVPGIRRHFFPVVSGKSIFSYGPDPAADLRSDDFDGDPAPVRIEDAYMRSGTVIINNELISEYRFEAPGAWVQVGDVQIQNNEASFTGVATLTHTLTLTPGQAYRMEIQALVNIGELVVRVWDGVTPDYEFTLDTSGEIFRDFTPTTATEVQIECTDASYDAQLLLFSILPRGSARLELPDQGMASDYHINVHMDQLEYNREHTKGTAGRPYKMLYSRAWPLSEILFDNAGISGDILVMDVLVNRLAITDENSVLRIHEDAERWVKYALAQEEAPTYGKALTKQQLDMMSEAYSNMTAGNRRKNRLETDGGLLKRQRFNINRGDP